MADTPAQPRRLHVLDPKRPLAIRRQAVVNLWDFLVRGGIADITRTPSEVIDTGRTREVRRYLPAAGVARSGLPVLLVPPLGAQASCFDLRRDLSLAAHLVQQGRATFLVDYGPLTGEDRKVGVEHFLNDVLPAAIRRVSQDAGGTEVHLVGWCMGGLFALGATAVHHDLPIRSVAMVASPFDLSQNPLLAPIRAVGKLKKPRTLWNRREDRDFLGQIQAVDHIMNNMVAYPGRATLQVYQRLALRNELASGRLEGPTKVVDLADVRVPVMNVAGATDVLVPQGAAHHVGQLLPNSPDVRLPLAPGGHLGVLTGTQAPATTWVQLDEFLRDHDEPEVELSLRQA